MTEPATLTICKHPPAELLALGNSGIAAIPQSGTDFPGFFKICFSIMFLFGICLPDDGAFISMAGDCKYPAVASEGNGVFIAWLATEGRTASLYFRKSADEGKTWTKSRKMSEKNGDCQPPSLAVNSGIVHLVWIDCGEVIDGELYYARSVDGGETWKKSAVLVDNVNSAHYPFITCGGDDVYLIWQDVGTKVFFKASHDKGKTWEKEMLLGEVGKHSCYCFPPALSVNGNELMVVWTDLREDKDLIKADKKKRISSVACRKSPDNGRTWSNERILTSTSIPDEMKDEIDNPTMFSGGSRYYLFWQDKHDLPLGEIIYAIIDPASKESPITGKRLFPAQKRSPKCPSVVFDKKGNLHYTWASFFKGESIIHYCSIDPEGNTLVEKRDLTTTMGRYHNPAITMTPSGLMHIFWFNEPADKKEAARIFLKTSKDGGLTWENQGSQ